MYPLVKKETITDFFKVLNRQAVKMSSFLFLCFFLFFTTSTIAEDCFINCYCEEYRAECTLRTCLDDINTENMEEIVIHGQLCPSHTYTLTHIPQHPYIILKDANCEEIPNCQ